MDSIFYEWLETYTNKRKKVAGWTKKQPPGAKVLQGHSLRRCVILFIRIYAAFLRTSALAHMCYRCHREYKKRKCRICAVSECERPVCVRRVGEITFYPAKNASRRWQKLQRGELFLPSAVGKKDACFFSYSARAPKAWRNVELFRGSNLIFTRWYGAIESSSFKRILGLILQKKLQF